MRVSIVQDAGVGMHKMCLSMHVPLAAEWYLLDCEEWWSCSCSLDMWHVQSWSWGKGGGVPI